MKRKPNKAGKGKHSGSGMTAADKVLKLGNEICDFLESTGGSYKNLSSEVVHNVFWSLGTGHYVWEPGRYFACYWRIRPEDIEDVKARIKPLDIVHGDVMYVADAASKGRLSDMIRALRRHAPWMNGAFWHRPAKQGAVYHFGRQRGIVTVTR